MSKAHIIFTYKVNQAIKRNKKK